MNSAPHGPSLSSGPILVVDDDPDSRGATAMLLSHLGYSVKTADNAHAALSVLREMEDIRVLLTDVVMPGGLNGFELAAEARRLRSDLCVVYLTGYSRELLPDAGPLHGRLLLKPWTIDQLEAEIRRCLFR